jgi:hypothetical protein
MVDWLEGLRDGTTRARITARLDRLKAGLLGDWKSVGGAIYPYVIVSLYSGRSWLTCWFSPSAIGLRNASPSVFHQRQMLADQSRSRTVPSAVGTSRPVPDFAE